MSNEEQVAKAFYEWWDREVQPRMEEEPNLFVQPSDAFSAGWAACLSVPAEVEWEYGIQGRSRVNPMPSEVLARGTIAVCSPEMAEKDLRQRWVTRGPWVPVVAGDQ